MPRSLSERLALLKHYMRKAVVESRTQLRIMRRHGPRGNRAYVKYALTERVPESRFANGLASTLDPRSARKWQLLHRRSLVTVLLGDTAPAEVAKWAVQMRATLNCHFLVSPGVAAELEMVDPVFYTECSFLSDADSTDLDDIRDWLQQHWRSCDVLLVDLANPLIDPFEALRLEHASQVYEGIPNEVGFVAPALQDDDGIVAGWEWDRLATRWIRRDPPAADFGQDEIPRYVLGSPVHGLYISSEVVDRVAVTRADLRGLDFAGQVRKWQAAAWRQNLRTLAFNPVRFPSMALVAPPTTEYDLEWLMDRRVESEEGGRRIIFVLPATSISGGIKTVLEQSGGLIARGFDVEIWSLQGQPTWMELELQVTTFSSYSDLLHALRNQDAIKVATWWESAQIVWLASVNTGIGVYYVQEFETWFYPTQPVSRAAVVASYRREMINLTIATYQITELANVGVEGIVVSSGYDDQVFRQLDVPRDDDRMLAVGRSFFQKNFAMTLSAWQFMSEKRPYLSLYGFEPDIVDDERVTYHERPSNDEVNVLYNEATCFVQTSRHEGFCLPVIEAMAAGCPVITTDSHGNRDFCFDDVNCIMVEQDDVEGLAAAIDRLMNDVALQDRLRTAALETAQGFTWPAVLDKLSAFYEEVT